MKSRGKKNIKKARGILIGYSGYPDKLNFLMPDNGLANLAGSLLSVGHSVKILDVETIDFIVNSCRTEVKHLMNQVAILIRNKDTNEYKLVEALKSLECAMQLHQEKLQYEMAQMLTATVRAEDIHFIGFKLWEGIGCKGSIRIAEYIKKECPNIHLFAGGPHADLYCDVLFKQTKVFDAIALGDGEETIIGLAEFAIDKRRLDDIPNIAFWDGSTVYRTHRRWIEDINDLPIPCYDDEVYPAMRGNNKIKVLTLDDSRGCPNLCHFCIHPQKSGAILRKKSEFRIRSEIEYLKNSYGYSCFRYAGSSPSLTALGNTDVPPEIHPKGNMLYTAFLHAGDIGHTDLQKAHEQGCYAVFIGMESANPKQLKEIYGKKATLEQIEQAISSAKQAGIYTVVSVIFPGPGENSKTRKETISFLIDMQPNSVLVIPPGILPGTEWYRNYRKYGFEFNSDDFLTKLMEFERPRFVPVLWGKPLCYTVDGKDHKTLIQETQKFSSELTNNGITVGVSDEAALLAHLAGYPGWEAQFNNKVKIALLTGQTEILSSIVENINHSVSKIAMGSQSLFKKDKSKHREKGAISRS